MARKGVRGASPFLRRAEILRGELHGEGFGLFAFPVDGLQVEAHRVAPTPRLQDFRIGERAQEQSPPGGLPLPLVDLRLHLEDFRPRRRGQSPPACGGGGLHLARDLGHEGGFIGLASRPHLLHLAHRAQHIGGGGGGEPPRRGDGAGLGPGPGEGSETVRRAPHRLRFGVAASRPQGAELLQDGAALSLAPVLLLGGKPHVFGVLSLLPGTPLPLLDQGPPSRLTLRPFLGAATLLHRTTLPHQRVHSGFESLFLRSRRRAGGGGLRLKGLPQGRRLLGLTSVLLGGDRQQNTSALLLSSGRALKAAKAQPFGAIPAHQVAFAGFLARQAERRGAEGAIAVGLFAKAPGGQRQEATLEAGAAAAFRGDPGPEGAAVFLCGLEVSALDLALPRLLRLPAGGLAGTQFLLEAFPRRLDASPGLRLLLFPLAGAALLFEAEPGGFALPFLFAAAQFFLEALALFLSEPLQGLLAALLQECANLSLQGRGLPGKSGPWAFRGATGRDGPHRPPSR